MQKNGSLPNHTNTTTATTTGTPTPNATATPTSPQSPLSSSSATAGASSTTSRLFSRTGSLFVSNRKAKERERAAAAAALLATATATTAPTAIPTTTNTPPSPPDSADRETHTGGARDVSTPSTTPSTTASTTTATTASTTASTTTTTDTSLPPTLIPTRSSSKASSSKTRPHRHSHSTTNIDLSSLRRSISLRSVTSPHKHPFAAHSAHSRGTSNSSSTAGGDKATPPHASPPPLQKTQHQPQSPPPPPPAGTLHGQLSRPLLHIPAFAKRQKSADALSSLSVASDTASPIDGPKSGAVIGGGGGSGGTGGTGIGSGSNMSSTVSSYRSGQTTTGGRPPAVSMSSVHSSAGASIGSMQMQSLPQQAGSQTPAMVYQHIMDTASKRISTLDYLRKAHEGRVYWFNTLLFTKPDLLKFSYFQPAKLARRATNYLLLGFSLPTILDLNSQTPTEYLKALNALLVEFEQYQQLHPPDGSIPSSLSRARVPQMFKRTTGKSRRQSSATDFSSTLGSTPEGFASASSFASGPHAANDSNALLPQENYQHLLTPSLPFDPDFFETFATLCDVLIDCYTKVTQLIRGPDMCTVGIGELFGKADARVRKVIVAGVVREFEERCREGVKSEVAGVGKVVLGGLM